jgi:hypothetical protein
MTLPRKPVREEDQQFSPKAVAWLLSLAKEYFPMETAKAYPRIVNMLAENWDNAVIVRPYLDSLLVDDRGGRAGFPLPILRELIALKELRNKIDPREKDIWDKAHLIRGK